MIKNFGKICFVVGVLSAPLFSNYFKDNKSNLESRVELVELGENKKICLDDGFFKSRCFNFYFHRFDEKNGLIGNYINNSQNFNQVYSSMVYSNEDFGVKINFENISELNNNYLLALKLNYEK